MIKFYYSLSRNILTNGIFILSTHLFLVIQAIFLKSRVVGFNWVKAVRGGSLIKYKCSESMFKS